MILIYMEDTLKYFNLISLTKEVDLVLKTFDYKKTILEYPYYTLKVKTNKP